MSEHEEHTVPNQSEITHETHENDLGGQSLLIKRNSEHSEQKSEQDDSKKSITQLKVEKLNKKHGKFGSKLLRTNTFLKFKRATHRLRIQIRDRVKDQKQRNHKRWKLLIVILLYCFILEKCGSYYKRYSSYEEKMQSLSELEVSIKTNNALAGNDYTSYEVSTQNTYGQSSSNYQEGISEQQTALLMTLCVQYVLVTFNLVFLYNMTQSIRHAYTNETDRYIMAFVILFLLFKGFEWMETKSTQYLENGGPNSPNAKAAEAKFHAKLWGSIAFNLFFVILCRCFTSQCRKLGCGCGIEHCTGYLLPCGNYENKEKDDYGKDIIRHGNKVVEKGLGFLLLQGCNTRPSSIHNVVSCPKCAYFLKTHKGSQDFCKKQRTFRLTENLKKNLFQKLDKHL